MPGGRKQLYDPDTFPLLGERAARKGLSDVQISASLGISHETFYQYQKKYPEFYDAIKRGKKPVDVEVENSLLKRALGFEYEEKQTEVEIGSDGQPKPVRIRTTKKYIPGDVGAMAFWLKNRMPEEWKERQSFEGNFTINQFTDLMKKVSERKSIKDES